jgi:hypothetical protein
VPILYLRFIGTGSTSTITLSGTTGTGGARSAARGRPGARHGNRSGIGQGVPERGTGDPRSGVGQQRDAATVPNTRCTLQSSLSRMEYLLPCTVALEVQSRRGVPRPCPNADIQSIFDLRQDSGDPLPVPLPPREREPCSLFDRLRVNGGRKTPGRRRPGLQMNGRKRATGVGWGERRRNPSSNDGLRLTACAHPAFRQTNESIPGFARSALLYLMQVKRVAQAEDASRSGWSLLLPVSQLRMRYRFTQRLEAGRALGKMRHPPGLRPQRQPPGHPVSCTPSSPRSGR